MNTVPNFTAGGASGFGNEGDYTYNFSATIPKGTTATNVTEQISYNSQLYARYGSNANQNFNNLTSTSKSAVNFKITSMTFHKNHAPGLLLRTAGHSPGGEIAANTGGLGGEAWVGTTRPPD